MHKNGDKYVVDFACAKSRCIVIPHNLTNMCQIASACIGLHMGMVPMALFVWDYKLDYSQIIIQIIHTHQIYAMSRSALGHIHIPLNQTWHNIHFIDGCSLHTKVSNLSCVCVLIAMLYRSGSATMYSHCWCTCVSVPPRLTYHQDTPPTLWHPVATFLMPAPSVSPPTTTIVHVRGHPSISLLPVSSPTLHLSICILPLHLCTITKDHTHSQQLLGPMVWWLPRSWLTNSRQLSTSLPTHTSTASDGLRMYWDRSVWCYSTLCHHVDSHIREAWY
jgi:hypothetical protein